MIIRATCASTFKVQGIDTQYAAENCAATGSGFPAGGGALGGELDKSLFKPICLGARNGVPDADGTCREGMKNGVGPVVTKDENPQTPTPLCRPLAFATPRTQKSAVPPKRCCPKCPHCPICPMCPKVVCPRCASCPPFSVCQDVNGVNNCTNAASALSVEQPSGSEITPSGSPGMTAPAAAPGFSSDASAATPAGSGTPPAPTPGTPPGPVPAVAYSTISASTAASAKRVATSELEATISLSESVESHEFSETQRQSFVDQAESILANALQMPVSSIHVNFEAEDHTLRVHIDGDGNTGNARSRLSEAFQNGALDFGEQGAATGLTINEVSRQPAPVEVSDPSDEEFDEDLDSRERLLWLSAVVPVSVLLVLSIAANVVLVTHYSRMLKGARFQFRSSSAGDVYRSTPMPAL